MLGCTQSTKTAFDDAMPRDPFIREKFTKNHNAARKHAAEYFQRFPKDRYQTEVESWRELQSQNIEFTMKRCASRSMARPASPGQSPALVFFRSFRANIPVRRCVCHLRSSPSSAHLSPTAFQSARQRYRQSSCRSAPCSHAAFKSLMSSSDQSFPSFRSGSKSRGGSGCRFRIASLAPFTPAMVHSPSVPAR
jgi:hypothetical protein